MTEDVDGWAGLDLGPLHLPAAGNSVLYTAGELNLYQRLIQYFTVVSEYGGRYVDLINFNRRLFPNVIDIQQIEAVFQPEHGYGCPDGSVEVGDLVREYEAARVARFRHRANLANTGAEELGRIAVGIGAGTTGVINCLIPAIRDYYDTCRDPRSRTVVLTVPLYSVYDGIVRVHGLSPRYLRTQRANRFLPTSAEVEEQLRSRPMAIVLTFPSNPAQTTYGPEQWRELERIVNLCKSHETFLIADNIYQDTLWNPGAINPEILGFTGRSDYLIKVFGLSKDRPGGAGLRIGYFAGDARVKEQYFYYSSIQYNTPNSLSRCVLVVDLLFRLALLRGRPLMAGDLDLLHDHMAGWGRVIDRSAVWAGICDRRLFDSYSAALAETEETQRRANALLRSTAESLGVFSDIINDNIGNLLLLKIDPSYFEGSCHDLFLYLMNTTKLGILPANVFGFPISTNNSWFRITTIHDTPEVIARQLEEIAHAVRRREPRSGS